ncbi:MAG: class I SAM-dependent methyltransferase [Gemmatimonadetes bacterium]|nr:class I SAM-dependent methyltransferase [Gemmatimonadota bacterium]
MVLPRFVKRYDEVYFTRWYGRRGGVIDDDLIVRRARLALAAAEYVLERPVRSVLDVGCGEGRWRAPLKRARPGLTYQGIERSQYVVRRFGRRRNIRHGALGTLGQLRLRRSYDLVVCSDVLHYVPIDDVRKGLAALRRVAGGLLWLDAFTAEDDFVGDREGWQPRSERAWRRIFTDAGLVSCGLNCWVPRASEWRLAALEQG